MSEIELLASPKVFLQVLDIIRSALFLIHMDVLAKLDDIPVSQAGNLPEPWSGTAMEAAASCNYIRRCCGPSLCLLISGVVTRLSPPCF